MKKMISILTCSTALFACPLYAQNKFEQDPFSDGKANASNKSSEKNQDSTTLSLCYEVFSFSVAEAAAIQRKGLSDRELYQKMIDGLTNNKSTQEVFAVLRAIPEEPSNSVSTPTFQYRASINANKTLVKLRWGSRHIINSSGDMRDLNVGVTAHVSQPTMVATFNYIPDSKIDPDSVKKICYAFVTISVVKP